MFYKEFYFNINCLYWLNFFPSERRGCISLKTSSVINLNKTLIQSSKLLSFSLFRIMATLRNKQKLEAVSRNAQESAKNGQWQNIFVPGMTEEYISQVSEEKEGRFTKKLSQEFSRTESRFLGALSKLDEFPLKPQVRTCSGTVPGTSHEKRLRKLGFHRGLFPKWSLTQNGFLCSSG